MSAIEIFNIEASFPSRDEARQKVLARIRQARQSRVRVLKIIHGYGSSGAGGTLRVGLRKSFRLRKKEKIIRDFIPGEDFTVFDQRVLPMLEGIPALRGDSDIGATNEGITVLWLE